MNTVFFYLGIQKDSPKMLRAILDLAPQSESERWLKIVTMGNYFLAAYASPYDIVVFGIEQVMVEAAKLYDEVVSGKLQSPLTQLPRMLLLFIMQSLLRDGYSFEFFKNAIDEAALKIDAGPYDDNIKAFSLFFLAVASIDIGSKDVFDFLIRTRMEKLPLEIEMAMKHEFHELKGLTTLMKKQDKQVNRKLKHNSSLLSAVKKLYDIPIQPTKAKTKDSRKK